MAAHLSKAYADELKRQQDDKQQNRAVLSIIVDIVIRFLARQNISLRGHRESDSDNSGNFLQLVHFTAKFNGFANFGL